jgi:hypothetical protein
MKPAIFEMSPDTRFLRQKLRALGQGVEVSYADLGKEIGKEVGGGFPALQSAVRGLLKEGYVFSPIRGVGLRRLTDAEIVSASDGDITSLRRRAKRAAKKLSSVEYQKLTPAQQLAHTAKTSIMGAVASMTTDRAVNAIEKVAGGKAGELPIRETMKALGYAA